MAGRGFGKTRVGSETIRRWQHDGFHQFLLVGRTSDEVRDYMVEGPAGILATAPNWNRPKYLTQKRRIVWPNGAIATLRSADEPDSIRGQNAQKAWFDEVSSWKHIAAFQNANFGLRIKPLPQAVITTTPKTNAITKRILGYVAQGTAILTRGSTSDNLDNLAPEAVEDLYNEYKGTRLGRQELEGEYMEDVDGTLWPEKVLDACRIKTLPPMDRIVIAVDPNAKNKEGNDEAGVVAAGMDKDGQYYVLRDVSGHHSPDGWANAAIELYREFDADCIVAEVNNGGDMVEKIIRDKVGSAVRIKTIHAAKGKHTRAEPISALYEQGKVFHGPGDFDRLEDQMRNMTANGYVGNGSPDRLDATVYALTELSSGKKGSTMQAYAKRYYDMVNANGGRK